MTQTSPSSVNMETASCFLASISQVAEDRSVGSWSCVVGWGRHPTSLLYRHYLN